ATGLWDVGALAKGAQATLTLTTTVASAAAQTNTARVSRADQFDPDPGNNQASATETPQRADLALTKTVSNATPNVSDTVTFTVTLRNNGPDAAIGSTARKVLPAVLAFAAAMPRQGTATSTSGHLDVRTLDVANPLTRH